MAYLPRRDQNMLFRKLTSVATLVKKWKHGLWICVLLRVSSPLRKDDNMNNNDLLSQFFICVLCKDNNVAVCHSCTQTDWWVIGFGADGCIVTDGILKFTHSRIRDVLTEHEPKHTDTDRWNTVLIQHRAFHYPNHYTVAMSDMLTCTNIDPYIVLHVLCVLFVCLLFAQNAWRKIKCSKCDWI